MFTFAEYENLIKKYESEKSPDPDFSSDPEYLKYKQEEEENYYRESLSDFFKKPFNKITKSEKKLYEDLKYYKYIEDLCNLSEIVQTSDSPCHFEYQTYEVEENFSVLCEVVANCAVIVCGSRSESVNRYLSDSEYYNRCRRVLSDYNCLTFHKKILSVALSACCGDYIAQKTDRAKLRRKLKNSVNLISESNIEEEIKEENIILSVNTPEEIWIKKAENLQLNNFCEINYLYKKLPATFMKLNSEIRFKLLNLREYYRENNIWGSFIK